LLEKIGTFKEAWMAWRYEKGCISDLRKPLENLKAGGPQNDGPWKR